MSYEEQALLLINWLGGFHYNSKDYVMTHHYGEKWESCKNNKKEPQKFFTEYKMIHNIDLNRSRNSSNKGITEIFKDYEALYKKISDITGISEEDLKSKKIFELDPNLKN